MPNRPAQHGVEPPCAERAADEPAVAGRGGENALAARRAAFGQNFALGQRRAACAQNPPPSFAAFGQTGAAGTCALHWAGRAPAAGEDAAGLARPAPGRKGCAAAEDSRGRSACGPSC
ncbi:MAG: hypothetical protein ACLT98_08585 [Eggerthellaceae bacterium]